VGLFLLALLSLVATRQRLQPQLFSLALGRASPKGWAVRDMVNDDPKIFRDGQAPAFLRSSLPDCTIVWSN
jgi:hypothetical protein